jgi:tetratricopeptide (TPR) repeat protein
VSAALNAGNDGEYLKYISKLEACLPQKGGYVGFYRDFIATRHLIMGKPAEAMAFATKMLTTFKGSGMPFGIAWARMLISQSAYEMGNVTLAEKELHASIRSFHQAGMAHFEFTACLVKALSLYQGAFLKDADDPWATSYRERLRYRYLRGIQRLGEHLEKAGQFDRAVDLYRKGLDTDMQAEDMYYRLMKCHMAAGRKSAAMATYETCRKVLRSVLRIDPSRKTQAAYRALSEQLNANK